MFGLGAVRRAFDAEVVCVKCRLPGLHPKSPPISRQAVGSMVGVVLCVLPVFKLIPCPSVSFKAN